MKLISWNVNGIRAILSKGFLDVVQEHDPDILCLQETKAHPDQVDMRLVQYPFHYWNSAEKKGYSGTAIFTKSEPLQVTYGLGVQEHDKEGRVITLEFPSFFLVNCYTPNAQPELARLPYRLQWDAAFLRHLINLEKVKPVIACGDLNVAHKEIDLKNPKANRKNPGFSDQERAGFDNLVTAGFIDTFRHFYPDKEGAYTWWSYRFNARDKNIGWRIDYFVISSSLLQRLQEACILDKVLGSDHCPVGITIK